MILNELSKPARSVNELLKLKTELTRANIYIKPPILTGLNFKIVIIIITLLIKQFCDQKVIFVLISFAAS